MIERILATNELWVEDRAAAHRTSGADYADCLLGLLNRDLGCATTVTFGADAATLPEFQAL